MPCRTAACSQNADWPHPSFVQVTVGIRADGARNFGLALCQLGPGRRVGPPPPGGTILGDGCCRHRDFGGPSWCRTGEVRLLAAPEAEAVANTPANRAERSSAKTGSRRAVPARAGGLRGRRGHPVLQPPLLGAVDGERRNRPGIRGVLFEVPEVSTSAAATRRITAQDAAGVNPGLTPEPGPGGGQRTRLSVRGSVLTPPADHARGMTG